jgi:Tol biopolymer transport system component
MNPCVYRRVWETCLSRLLAQTAAPIRGLARALILSAIPAILAVSARAANEQPAGASPDLLNELKTCPYKIAHESFRDGNWEIYVCNADGSNPVNLTQTPDVDELYPKVSPDGSKICFQADEGQGDAKARSLYLMNSDGTDRIKIADQAREPCWSADGKEIAYLPNEFDKFTYADGATKGIRIYNLASRRTRAHPNKEIVHLYTLNWSPDGRWFVATIHGGMGFKHSIIALQANGDGVFDLGLGGCRPDLRSDGKKVAWGNGDYAMGCAAIDLSGPTPVVTHLPDIVESKEFETYHVDWSPDGKYIAYSYGPKFKGKNLKHLLPEFPGVEAPGWNTCVADTSTTNRWVQITFDGKSNKEPDWMVVTTRPGK